MKYQVKLSKYDAARLWQYSNQFCRSDKLYRKAMSDILCRALQDYFDEPNDNHDD